MIKTLNFSKFHLNINKEKDDIINNEFLKNKLNNLNLNTTYLLNDLLPVENKYDIIQKFINKIYLFHHKRLELDENKNYYISFTIENEETFHLDYFKDESNKERVYPICTTLTYFDNCLRPVVLTDINFEDYKYKNFKPSTNLLFSFPSSLDHICFDGRYYYGNPLIFKDKNNNQSVLKINIWDKKPLDIKEYDCMIDDIENDNKLDIEFKESLGHRQLFLDTKLINKSFLEEIFYAKNNYKFVEFENIFYNIEKYYSIEENIKTNPNLEYKLPVEVNLLDCNNLIIIQTEYLPIIQNEIFNKLKNKYGNILHDLYQIYYKKELSNVNNFYKHKLLNKYYTKDTCRWILNQANNYIRLGQILVTNMIRLDNSKNIFDFCLVCIESLYDNISYLYGINNIKIDIKNMSILYINNNKYIGNDDNYEKNQNNLSLEINKNIINGIKNNNSFMLAIIKLNDSNIDINENIKLQMGDLLFVNTLRFDELNLFNNEDTNYYLVYEIDFKYEL